MTQKGARAFSSLDPALDGHFLARDVRSDDAAAAKGVEADYSPARILPISI
jgi:hypothetical protein